MSNPPLVKARYSTPGRSSSSSRAARHSFCSTLTRMSAAMPWPDLGRVDGGGEPGDDPVAAQPVEPGVGGRPADAHLAGQAVHRQPAVVDEGGDDAPVDVVERASGWT